MIRIRVAALTGAAAAGLLALSACSERVAAAPTAADQVVEEPPPTGLKLTATELGTLGAVVTDQNGRTLYRFDKDKNKPPASNCNAECTRSWPPVTVQDPAQLELAGVDRKLVGTVQRSDGTVQLTLNGWPLYRSAKDAKAGDINGQGANGTWFASTPHGKKAEATKPAPPANGGAGY